MSLGLKEKRKAQEDLRRLMTEREKVKKPKKIDNPLAKYNSSGQLTCILCSSIVKSENVWSVHVKTKQHRENIDNAKKLKESTNNFTTVQTKRKNKSTPSEAPSEKKPKGILKNSTIRTDCAESVSSTVASTSVNTSSQSVPYHNEEIKRLPLNTSLLASETPAVEMRSINEDESKPPQSTSDQPIPEGFFDDPMMDAKVRKIEYKDPAEEEWERFLKEMKEEASTSAEIIADEQIEATVERQINEIDEQMRNWNRVLNLEVKKEEATKKTQDVEQLTEDNSDNSDVEENIDEFLDWRAKRS